MEIVLVKEIFRLVHINGTSSGRRIASKFLLPYFLLVSLHVSRLLLQTVPGRTHPYSGHLLLTCFGWLLLVGAGDRADETCCNINTSVSRISYFG